MTIGTARRDRFRKLANRIRAIPGERFGLRPHQVFFVTASTDGTILGDGTRAESVVELTEAHGQPPKVRWLKNDELALGQLAAGTVEIGPITPPFATGGTELDAVTGDGITTGQIYLLRILGPQHPNGADYRISSTKLDRAIHWTIQAAPVGSQV